MSERQTYTMTAEQESKLLDACQAVRVMKIGSYVPSSPQENANRAWQALGDELGFDGMTVRPSGSNQRQFTAIALAKGGDE